MIKEAIEFIRNQTLDNFKPFVLSGVKTNDPLTVLLVNKDGDVTERDLGTPPRKFQARTIASLAAAALRYGTGHVSVWVDFDSITCILDDDEDRTSIASLSLRQSPIFGALERLGTNAMPLKDLVIKFRQQIKPAACAVEPATTLASLEQYKVTETVTADNRSARDGLGKAIVAETSGTSPIPQSVRFTFDAYPGVEGLNHKATVECSLEIFPTDKVVHLQPMPGEIDGAKEVALEKMRDFVAGVFAAATKEYGESSEYQVYCGSPK